MYLFRKPSSLIEQEAKEFSFEEDYSECEALCDNLQQIADDLKEEELSHRDKALLIARLRAIIAKRKELGCGDCYIY